MNRRTTHHGLGMLHGTERAARVVATDSVFVLQALALCPQLNKEAAC